MGVWAALTWGLFGGLAVEALDLTAAIRRCHGWPWKRRGEVDLAPYAFSVIIRAGVGGGMAAAACLSGQISTVFAALTAGVAAPLMLGQLAKQLPGDPSQTSSKSDTEAAGPPRVSASKRAPAKRATSKHASSRKAVNKPVLPQPDSILAISEAAAQTSVAAGDQLDAAEGVHEAAANPPQPEACDPPMPVTGASDAQVTGQAHRPAVDIRTPVDEALSPSVLDLDRSTKIARLALAIAGEIANNRNDLDIAMFLDEARRSLEANDPEQLQDEILRDAGQKVGDGDA